MLRWLQCCYFKRDHLETFNISWLYVSVTQMIFPPNLICFIHLAEIELSIIIKYMEVQLWAICEMEKLQFSRKQDKMPNK